MALSWSPKDPDAILDYEVDWSVWLNASGNDTISTSVWIIPANLTKESDLIPTATTTRIWLSGGIVGVTYELVNRITTLGGRTQDQTIKLKCRER